MGKNIELDIYTPKNFVKNLTQYSEFKSNIHIRDIPKSDKEFFTVLAQADVLILPVNFDRLNF